MIEIAFVTLLRVTAELSLILLALLVLRPILRRALGAGCAYSAWWLAPLLLAVAQLPASRSAQAVQAAVALELPMIAQAHIDPTRDWMSVFAAPLLALWMGVAIACIVVLVVRQQRFMRDLRLQANGRWQAPAGSGPALVGLRPARLCLPADFEQRFTPDQQRLILAHEEVHRARHDNAWNLIALSACVLQWFNPLAWLALRALRVDQELSCDAAVLRAAPAQAAEYAKALLNAQGSPALALPWASWRSVHPLVERISMLKIHTRSHHRRNGLLTLTLLGLFGAGAVHALQSEPASNNEAKGKADVRLTFSMVYSEPRPEPAHVQKWRTSRVVDVVQGQPYQIAIGGPNEQQVQYTITALPHGAGRWQLDVQVRRGEPWRTVASPKMIVADGSPATTDSSFDGGGELIAFMVATTLRDGQPVATSAQQ